jgi:hypothetical protein
MAKHHHTITKTAFIVGGLMLAANQPIHAQTYTTMPLGNGWSTTTGPEGVYTTMPLGNGWSTTMGPGGTSTTMPLGNGWSTTTVTPNYLPRIQPIQPFR